MPNLSTNIRPERLPNFIAIIERELGRTAVKIFEPLPPGRSAGNYADIDASTRDLGYRPHTSLAERLPRLIS